MTPHRFAAFSALALLAASGCGGGSTDTGDDGTPDGEVMNPDGGTDGGSRDGAPPADLGGTDMGPPPSSVAQIDVLLETSLDVQGGNAEVVFDADGAQLFAASGGDHPLWNIFELDSDGAPRLVQKFGIFLGDTPLQIATAPTTAWAVHGQWLVTLRREDGRVRELPDTRIQLPDFGTRELLVDDSGTHLYALMEDGGWVIQLMTLAADGVPTVTETYDASAISEVPAGADLVDVALSPDGAQLYAIGGATDSVFVFRRDSGTGALTYEATVSGVGDPTELVLSADGAHVYALGSSSIEQLDRSATGALTEGGSLSLGVEARWLAIAPDDSDLYVGTAIDAGTAGSVIRLTRDADSASATFGSLTIAETSTLTDDHWITDVVVAPNGSSVYALTGSPRSSDDVQGSLARFARGGDGALGAEERFEDRAPQVLDEAAGVAVHPNGEWVYAVGVRSTENVFGSPVRGVARAAWNGSLVDGGYHSCLDDGDRACTVWDLAFGTDGTLAVGSGREGIFGALFFFDVDPTTGELTLATVLDGESNSLFDFDEVLDLALVDDGGRTLVYVVDEDALSVASQPNAGSPSFIARLEEGDDSTIEGARGIAATADGAFVYLVNGESILTVDTERLFGGATRTTAVVQRIGGTSAGVTGLDGAQRVALAPTETHAYVVSDSDASIAIFERGADGMLSFIESVPNGLGGVGESTATAGDTLASDYDLTITPDGQWLVVSANLSLSEPVVQDGVAVFRRDEATGALTLVRAFRQGEMGASGLAGASGAAVHPSSSFAFTSAGYSGGLAAFSLGE